MISPAWRHLIRTYQQRGLLRSDFTCVSDRTPRTDFLLLARRRHIYSDRRYLAHAAVHEVTHQGVSLVKLVKIPRGRRAAGASRGGAR
jgi:hypothetical protein